MLKKALLKKVLTGGSAVAAFGLGVLLFAAVPDTRLADAAQADELDKVRLLLKQNVNVNAAQGDGTTALHWAAFQDDVEMAKLLLAAGADVKAVTRLESLTPLHAAAKSGSAGIVDLLLKAKADANAVDGNGTTPLMLASASGNVDAVNLLVAHGAEVNAKDKLHGQTPLMFAAALNRGSAIRTLMEHGADAKITTTIAKQERVRLDQDGNPVTDDKQGNDKQGGDKQGNDKQAFTAKNGAADQAAKCAPAAESTKAADDGSKTGDAAKSADMGSKAAEKGSKGAGKANAKGGNTKADAKADAKTDAAPAEESPELKAIADLRTAAQSLIARIDDLEKQIKAGPADKGNGQQREKGATTLGGMTALLFAAREGATDSVHALLEKGADINQVNAADKTPPIVEAIMNGHFDLAKNLADRGADLNLADDLGLTPLYAVVDTQWAPKAWFPQPVVAQEKVTYLELMKDLLDHGANPNARLGKKLWFRSMGDKTWVDPSGATALWRATVALDVPAMKMLVSHGADPDLPTKGGDTILMVAAGLGWGPNFSMNVPDGWMDAVKYALELGGDVNAKDSRGYTALHGAAYMGNNEMIKFLIGKGADVKAVATDKNTVADMANGPNRFGMPHPETVALLEQLGSANSQNCRSDQCLVDPKDDSKDGGGRGGRGGGRGGRGGGGATAAAADSGKAQTAACPTETAAKTETVVKTETAGKTAAKDDAAKADPH